MNVILHLFKKPAFAVFGVGLTILLFDIQLYLLYILPANINNACTPQGYFTIPNALFALLISLLSTINIMGFLSLIIARHPTQAITTGTLSVAGIILATFTSFCTICTLPLISLFGIGLSLTFFTDYILQFKLLSFLFLLGGLFLLNKQYQNNCTSCKIDTLKQPT